MMQEVTVQGWVRTSRFAENHNIMFVELTDGSTVRGMQLVLTVATTVVRTSHFLMLCCAVLCCAVLCCAVLCCAVLCCDDFRCISINPSCPCPSDSN